MGAQRLSDDNNVAVIGPHPGNVAIPTNFLSQDKIDSLLYSRATDEAERSLIEAKEDSLRLKGVAWIDSVRRAMQMPIKTYTTSCIYYHKFRLAHPPGTKIGDAYFYSDAAAASLLVSCKSEETKKYSRDILAAVHNLKLTTSHEHVMADDPMFDDHSRSIIELERLILETIRFNFRDHNPHELLIKLAKRIDGAESGKALCAQAFALLTELYRTFAPLKHTAVTLCLASLELATHLMSNEAQLKAVKQLRLKDGSPTRPEVVEVILDGLDHYTRHASQSVLGSRFALDRFLQIRLHYNRECEANAIPRYAKPLPPQEPTQVQNGHPTPVSPAEHPTGEVGPVEHRFSKAMEKVGTLRFAMNPEDAIAEKDSIMTYLYDGYDEIEEEIEIPASPRQQTPRRPLSPDRRSDDHRPFNPRGGFRGRGRGYHNRGGYGDDFRRRPYDDRFDRRRGDGHRFEDSRWDERRRR